MLKSHIEMISEVAPQLPVIELDEDADVHAGSGQQNCGMTCQASCTVTCCGGPGSK